MDNISRPERKWVAQFSMGQMDYIRLDNILYALNDLSVYILRHDVEHIQPFAGALRTFYINMRPLISKSEKARYDEHFQKLRKFINDGFVKGRFKKGVYEDEVINVPEQFYEDLIMLYQELLQIKQEIGLGTELKKFNSQSDIIKKAFE